MKLCWFLTTFQSYVYQKPVRDVNELKQHLTDFNQMLLQLIDVPNWFLINMFLRVGFSRYLLVLFYCLMFVVALRHVMLNKKKTYLLTYLLTDLLT